MQIICSLNVIKRIASITDDSISGDKTILLLYFFVGIFHSCAIETQAIGARMN